MNLNRIKIARMERDITQKELGQLCGVTRQTIGLIESGNYNPTISLCNNICRVLGKTLDELFGEL
ncbi:MULTISPECIES: helix-turn-helix transcriptional regulator [unclassified Oceanispirochaeta]|uniref:helix-turn-helix transcriptional regulator n=1 Tax=unclassified Oceanispirochaeta TaxID=2635722 RepID=UPI000E0905A9|nr:MULTISPECIES: helix-turn-helix transcriptional regulator [unclassified Oceanispirochaeta]MBF9014002.1 helix-turn-helix transcriptional regulator [Oceanispirochaeta sp. M2]NPD70493.1 helix-turn-helix transcriptional regulator [Oceanispirochaeta sp. M1]RDG34262.1 transcriptional regulator [Oceanispirochaeta sp. M1]